MRSYTTKDYGELIRPTYVSSEFRKLVDSNNIPKIRLHDLRHSHATLLLKKGINPKIVQERLGHASIHLTLDTYSHVIPSMQKEAAKEIDDFFDGI